MPDNKSKRGPADRKRVSMTEEHEVRYWTKHFDCSREDLQEAVDKVGPMVSDVEGYFG
jgi:hypothetical protein